MNPKAYRLPRHIRPRRYDIALDARLGAEEFRGQVMIELEIAASGRAIELHARDLRVAGARLAAHGAELEGIVTLDQEREIARIDFDRPLPTGAARLVLDFDGRVSKGLEGLYLAQDGAEEVLCTQCEATSARAIFPCFDEPAFKARFAWRITTAPDATVLANGPLVSTETSADGSAKTWSFAPTKPMSSYLIGLVIGAIAATPEEIAAGVPLRVWAAAGKEQLGQFAQQYTTRLMPWYVDYFDVPYHWDKFDQVAVPGFAAGAMENSGLVLFRQSLLLMNPRTAAWQQEKGIASVVAHELAHMWFGNFVTMRWWDDLWLKEAFATWLACHVLDALSPEYDIWSDFQGSKDFALATDALANTHPIYTPVATAAEADELFDAITYQKGCAVLRMLHGFLGDADFRTGLRGYLHEFAEGNAAGADLWRHLQQASRQPVADMMESWITRAGHPIITLALDGAAGATVLHVSQQRFYSGVDAPRQTAALWRVPLVVRYEDRSGIHETRSLLTDRSASLPLPVDGELRWCYANAGETGFYRQQPDRALLSRLVERCDRLSPVEQIGLLRDQWALAQNGSQRLRDFLDVLAALARSDDYRVLARVVAQLHTLETLLEEAGDDRALAGFRGWVAQTFHERLVDCGWEPRPGEGHDRAQARVSVVDAMATLAHDPAAIGGARAWAGREAIDPAAVDPNLAPLVVRAAAQFGDDALFDEYVRIYRQRKAAGAAPQETDRYLYSFPGFRPPALVARTLQLVDDGVLPLESMAPLLRQMFGLRHARQAAWDYLKAHWATIEKVAGGWIPAAVAGTGQLPVALRPDIVAFFDAHLHGGAQQSYARALEQIDQRAEFQARTRDDLVAWFGEL